MQYNSLITYKNTDKRYVRYTQVAQKIATYLLTTNIEVNDTKTDWFSVRQIHCRHFKFIISHATGNL